MKFSFVVLTWNRYKFLEKCLEALRGSIEDRDDSEIIILDNGSTDRTPQILSTFEGHPHIRLMARKKNLGIKGYRVLFRAARGEYIVVVDDDVLELPPRIDAIFADYMRIFPDYGYLALNVIQNEYTNGAKPGPEQYVEVQRDGRTLLRGPTGGWCSCFRRSDYRKLWLKLLFTRLDMRNPEDGFLSANLEKRLSLKSGIIRDAVCFHAVGPYYASQYGHLDREIEKYTSSKLHTLADTYKKYLPPQ